jgi:hypothetical protein
MGGEALELQKPKQPIYADVVVVAAAAALFGYNLQRNCACHEKGKEKRRKEE